jgi:hypothetical protein
MPREIPRRQAKTWPNPVFGPGSQIGVATQGPFLPGNAVYVLVSTGVIITFLLAVFVIGWFIGRLRERRRGQRGEE